MLNERIDRLDSALHGAVQVRFDLSDAELPAVAGADEPAYAVVS